MRERDRKRVREKEQGNAKEELWKKRREDKGKKREGGEREERGSWKFACLRVLQPSFNKIFAQFEV